MSTSSLAGKPAPQSMLVDLARLERECYESKPGPGDSNQLVHFGTSAHRGSPLHGTFTEARPTRAPSSAGRKRSWTTPCGEATFMTPQRRFIFWSMWVTR